MKVKVQVEGNLYEVEIVDMNARPVVAIVEGERFEVWPEEAASPAQAAAETQAPQPRPVAARPPSANGRTDPRFIHAPIPGVIVAVAVQPGAAVAVGQELCALEAMKMKNIIRAPRAGTVAAVPVQVGQTVKHKDVLVEFAA